jgi:hypothetical protein
MAEDEKTQGTEAATGTEHVDAVEAAPFVDDIIIWADGLDAPRKLTHSQLQGLDKVPSTLMPTVNSLVKQGVVIAAIPTTTGIGASCYLVNLAALRRPDDNDGK